MSEVCCIKGCDKEVEAMGLCVNHYRMNRKYGSPVAQRPLNAIVRGMPMSERFWYSVDKKSVDECWEWKASKNRDGYGTFASKVGDIRWNVAHRYSWYLHTGEVLDSQTVIMHMCDNRSCVNPHHLKPGTTQDNTADMVEKGRQCKGERHHRSNAKFTVDQVKAICEDTRPYNKIAAEYDCHMQTVIDIKRRRTWKNIDVEVVNRKKRGCGGEDRSKNLKEDDIRAIRSSVEKSAALALKYKVSQQTICDIKKFRSWKHVT